MRINLSAVSAGPRLLGIVPIPAAGEKTVQLALTFLCVSGSAEPSGPTHPEIQLELLLLRGPPGGGKEDPAAHIKSLLARPGAIETDIAVSCFPGQKAAAESITEWIYPKSVSKNADILLPEAMATLYQGTTLVIESRSANNGVHDIGIKLNHDIRKPSLPLVTGRGATLLTPDNTMRFNVTVDESVKFTAGLWTAVKEIPLGPILGEADDPAKNDSCYIFGRVLAKGGG